MIKRKLIWWRVETTITPVVIYTTATIAAMGQRI